jgi:transcription elongation factor GreA
MTDKVPMTPQGYQQLQDELKQLETIDRFKIVKEIEIARAHGDLSENAEYHAAKEKQGLIEGRIRFVSDRVARAQVIEPGGEDPERVRFGATVVISELESGEQKTYRIVGEDEANAKNGTISVTSPLARALLGREVDSSIELKAPKGTRELEIVDIQYESTE